MKQIKVGFLLSYDYALIFNAIKCIYQEADTITLALDNEFKTWSGNSFQIPESFFNGLSLFDTQKKIRIYRDNFHIQELTSIENDTRERNMLAEYMGKENSWIIQLDSDEYFLDFKKFVSFLHRIEPLVTDSKVTICANIYPLFKKDNDGYFLINSSDYQRCSCATNYPGYQFARECRDKDMIYIFSSFRIIHETFARSEEEFLFKVQNWGHKDDFDTLSYYRFWKSINKDNYKYIRDFFPFRGQKRFWQSLLFCEGNIEQLLSEFTNHSSISIEDEINKAKRVLCKYKFRWLFVPYKLFKRIVKKILKR